MGVGIEREVIFTAFIKFTKQYSAWFSPRADSRATLQTSRGYMAARLISASRIQKVKFLGALSALLLICGISPEPFNPLLFYLIIHDFDLRCLTREILSEWHPELRQELDAWLSLGPSGDPSPFRSLFLSWINIDVRGYFMTFQEYLLIYFDRSVSYLDEIMLRTRHMPLKFYGQLLLDRNPLHTLSYRHLLRALVFPVVMASNLRWYVMLHFCNYSQKLIYNNWVSGSKTVFWRPQHILHPFMDLDNQWIR
jgi:hypothetical protein